MWARHLEFVLGLWLVISPFVFRVPGELRAVLAADLVVGSAVAVLALASYARAARFAHLGIVPLALALAGWARFAHDPAPWHENHILVGLLLAMFAVIPNDASRPPAGWRAAVDRPRPR